MEEESLVKLGDIATFYDDWNTRKGVVKNIMHGPNGNVYDILGFDGVNMRTSELHILRVSSPLEVMPIVIARLEEI